MSGAMRLMIVLFCAGAGMAQQTGTVTGHVYCADTNLPARFASVSLEPVEIGPERPMNARTVAATVKMVQTGLDGGFSISKMNPGTYYVVVQKLGYPSPIDEFSRSELEKPTADLVEQIAKAVPTVTVGAGQTATVEVRIEHGASIAGRVTFDDGSPAGDVTVAAVQRRSNGLWVPVEANGRSVWGTSLMRTDDQGRFRVLNLPPGEFLLEADFHLNEGVKTSMFDTGGSSYSGGGGGMDHLTVYAGNVFRQAQAMRIKLTAGEDHSGEEIVVPLAKLHTVSGGLVNTSGAVVNGGMVLLFDAQEKMPLAMAAVSIDTGMFHFSFVPEGRYWLDATGMDMVLAAVPAEQGAMTGVATRPKAVKTYGGQRQALVVRNDVTGLVLTMPERTAKAAAPQ